MAPIDYSRWDNIDSESEGEVVADSTRIQSRAPAKEVKLQPPPPQSAVSSAEVTKTDDVAVDGFKPTNAGLGGGGGEEAKSCRPAAELLFNAVVKKKKKKRKKKSKLIWYLESAVEEAHKLALARHPPPTPPTRSSLDSDEPPSSSSGLNEQHCFCSAGNDPHAGQRLEDLPEIQLLPRSPEKQAVFVCGREALQKRKKLQNKLPMRKREEAPRADNPAPPGQRADGGESSRAEDGRSSGEKKGLPGTDDGQVSKALMDGSLCAEKDGSPIAAEGRTDEERVPELGEEGSVLAAMEVGTREEVVTERPPPMAADRRLTFEDIRDRDFSPSGLVTEAERVETQYENEERLEELYFTLKSEKGLESTITLASFFKLFDVWIGLYRLRKCQKELDEVLPVCRRLGDPFKLKAVQAAAFTKWKQGHLTEALALFKEIEEIVGKSPALCENIGHTYKSVSRWLMATRDPGISSLGALHEAERYFKESLSLIEQQVIDGRGTESDSNLGGVYLGLGIVLERRGRVKEALQSCKKAHKFYLDKFEAVGGSSLVAKAGMSVAKCYMKLNNLAKAQKYAEEAVEIFERTCGEDSPLVASACHTLGKIMWRKGKREGARENLERAYSLEAAKDAVDIRVLMEVHNELVETHTEGIEKVNRLAFRKYIPIVEVATKNIQENVVQDGNAAVYYKLAAELYLWGGMYGECVKMVKMAIPLFKAERSINCTCFVDACERMLAYAANNVKLGVPVDHFNLPNTTEEISLPEDMAGTTQTFEIPVRSTPPSAGGNDSSSEERLPVEASSAGEGEGPSSRESDEFFDCEEDT
ncbi:hypothetical protein FOL46_006239 [Perkinsus olseni]|uniref:Uncharacterized protein n=2 Tax=Perkinsus olseni TaxID=32597 RepID=A0A7J6MYH0_PEROL|nr:hypothetical protein FOL46_006239 [Perkinsus olseni]